MTVLVASGVMFLAPMVPLAHSLLTLWIGPETAQGGGQILQTLVLGGIVGCGSNVFSYYAMGLGQNAPIAWLSLAYAVTLVGHPAISLPMGPDRFGMPFGLQIVGPRGGDAKVLAVAGALERLLAGDPRTARPVPDLARLQAALPIRDSEAFFGFG